MKHQPKQLFMNLALSAASIIVGCIALEIGLRTINHLWTLQNFSGVFVLRQTEGASVNVADKTGDVVSDPLLGWIHQPGIYDLWNTKVVVSEQALRSNGNPPDISGEGRNLSPILAVGDSFTFGHLAADRDTWPSALERLLHTPVLNAGVCGYGLDQAFLRAKLLVPQYHPQALILSLIPDDIYRSELSLKSGVKKPYFAIQSGKLVLKNSPLERVTQRVTRRDWFREIGGYSLLVHTVMIRLWPNDWIEPGYSVRAHRKGSEVACLLMQELDAFAQAQHVPVIVLMQYDTLDIPMYLRKAERLVTCLDNTGLHVLDLKTALTAVRDTDPARYARFFNAVGGHMTGDGNQFVAEQLQTFMQQQGILP
jgi:hypothetical protein